MEQSATPDRQPSWRRDPHWRERSACRDEDPDLFFPIGTGRHATEQTEAAKAVCRRCSVIDTCLAEALDTGEVNGIRGGLDQLELRRLVERRRGQAGQEAQARQQQGPGRPSGPEPDLTVPMTPKQAEAAARQLYRHGRPIPDHVRALANIAQYDRHHRAG
jgi:WhiB family transcriptional regulator, redox-sensing transcriptional regulator